MTAALEKYEDGTGRAVPIIIRETPGWHGHRIGRHLAFPTDGKPLLEWSSEDSYWGNVQEGLQKLIVDVFQEINSG